MNSKHLHLTTPCQYYASIPHKRSLEEMQEQLRQWAKEARLQNPNTPQDTYETAKKIFNVVGEELPF